MVKPVIYFVLVCEFVTSTVSCALRRNLLPVITGLIPASLSHPLGLRGGIFKSTRTNLSQIQLLHFLHQLIIYKIRQSVRLSVYI